MDWADLEEALAAASEAVLNDSRMDTEVARQEGVRFLTRFLAQASLFEMEADPAYPHLFRSHSAGSSNWFLPCPDGVYHYAMLDGQYDYRLRGQRGTAHLVNAHVFAGGYYDIPNMRVFDHLELDGSAEVDIVLSQRESSKPGIKIPPGPSVVLLRQWFYDWDVERQGEFLIERIGETYPAPPVNPADLEARWDRYVQFVRDTALIVMKSLEAHYAAPPDHIPFPTVMAAVSEHEGDDDPYSMRDQVYGQGLYRCGDDEAVILEVTPPTCKYWSFALYSQYWEVSDWLNRLTTINGHQAVIDDDGVFRLVISHRDPGVPNWLDTGGRPLGLICGRYVASDSVPEPSLRTVPFAELAGELPAGTPRITPAERQESLRKRTNALRLRWRP